MHSEHIPRSRTEYRDRWEFQLPFVSKRSTKPMAILNEAKTDIKVKLLPRSSRNQITRSSRNQIMGRDNDVFKVKVTSPPVDGLANKALIELLARSLRIPKGSIEIISGKSSRLKSVRIHGLSGKEINRLLKHRGGL
jgi:uncharacterized protein (TIGR00251 family)